MLNVSVTAKVLGWGELTVMNILPILIATGRVHYSLQVGHHNSYTPFCYFILCLFFILCSKRVECITQPFSETCNADVELRCKIYFFENKFVLVGKKVALFLEKKSSFILQVNNRASGPFSFFFFFLSFSSLFNYTFANLFTARVEA